jgi:hypothetical protein
MGLSKFKIGVFGVVGALMVAFGAFGLGSATQTAQADFVALYNIPSLAIAQQDDDFRDSGDCSSVGTAVTTDSDPNPSLVTHTVITLGEGESTWFCLILTDNQGNGGTDDSADVTFDSNDVGRWTEAVCANNDNDGDYFEITGDECVSIEGLNTDELTVDCGEQTGTAELCSRNSTTPDTGGILVEYTCSDAFVQTTIVISISDPSQGNETRSFTIRCLAEVDEITITARPTTVEIVPARSNTSHSFIDVLLTDEDGNQVASGIEVDFTTTKCSIETEGVDNSSERTHASLHVLGLSTANPASYFAWEFSTPADEPVDLGIPTLTRQSDSADSFQTTTGTRASAILGCNPVDAPGATPGVATVTACVEVTGPDI